MNAQRSCRISFEKNAPSILTRHNSCAQRSTSENPSGCLARIEIRLAACSDRQLYSISIGKDPTRLHLILAAHWNERQSQGDGLADESHSVNSLLACG